MTDPSSLLRAADPLRDQREGLSADDAQAIRQAMLRTHAASADEVGVRPVWRRPLPLAAAAALIATVSGVVGDRIVSRPELQEPVSTAAAPIASDDAERRQLQFATPGGTRIIWVFDDKLRLQEPIP